jgi:cytidylate kinase
MNGRPGRIITVDGPPASGKSTLARRLAVRLRMPFLSTGALYRAVTWAARRRGLPLTDAGALARLARNLDIRCRLDRAARLTVAVGPQDVTAALDDPAIARETSTYVAAVPAVRSAVVERSRRMAGARGLVAEGRDCGSVIFPAADVKLFLTASLAARALRRSTDEGRSGRRVDRARVRRDLARREREERARPVGRLMATPDAWIIDNSGMTPGETLALALRLARAA